MSDPILKAQAIALNATERVLTEAIANKRTHDEQFDAWYESSCDVIHRTVALTDGERDFIRLNMRLAFAAGRLSGILAPRS